MLAVMVLRLTQLVNGIDALDGTLPMFVVDTPLVTLEV